MLILVAGSAAEAGEGVVEINQARAVAGGITAGDAPGFPVTLDQRGSYRLTSDLSPGNATGIHITGDDVALDLNGFMILGPSIIFGTPNQNYGVDGASAERAIVRNGAVRQLNRGGIRLGPKAIVEGVIADDTGGVGIAVQAGSLVSGCSAHDNSGTGISAGDGSNVVDSVGNDNGSIGILVGQAGSIRGSVANRNGLNGISAAAGSLVVQNVMNGNTSFGINCGAFVGWGENVLSNNNGLDAEAPGSCASAIGTNRCNGNVCP